jgi:hypothetical protein
MEVAPFIAVSAVSVMVFLPVAMLNPPLRLWQVYKVSIAFLFSLSITPE